MEMRFIVIGGIILVIVVRRFNRIVASCLGVLLSIGIGVWGHLEYAKGPGHGVSLGPIGLSEPVFLLLVAVWLGIETYSLAQAIKRRGQRVDAHPDGISDDE
jgi:hypothetical protein